MAKFRLQLSKIRRDRIVPVKGEAQIEMTMEELVETVVPRKSTGDWRAQRLRRMQMAKLRLLEPSSYVGVMVSRKTGRPTTFFLMNPDRSNRIGWRLQQDPQFPSRVEVLYKVESVNWEGVAAPIEVRKS